MPLLFGQLSSRTPGGSDVFAVDAVKWLPEGETLSSADIASSDTDILTVQASATVYENTKAKFSVDVANAGLDTDHGKVPIYITVTSSGGKVKTFTRYVPVYISDDE